MLSNKLNQNKTLKKNKNKNQQQQINLSENNGHI